MKQNTSQSHFRFLKIGIVLERGVVELFSGGLIAMLGAQSRQFIGSIGVLRIGLQFLCKFLFRSGNIFGGMRRFPLCKIGSPDAVVYVDPLRIHIENYAVADDCGRKLSLTFM